MRDFFGLLAYAAVAGFCSINIANAQPSSRHNHKPANQIISTIKQPNISDINRPKLTVPDDLQLKQPEDNLTKNPLISKGDAQLLAILNNMKKGNWSAAQGLLAIELTKQNVPMDILFLAGQVAERQQNHRLAIAYYRQMLARDSGLARPRFELARMQYHVKKMQLAEKNFRMVLAQSPPKPVVSYIKKYLAAIKKQKFGWQVSLSVLPSTNVNTGTDAKTVMINGKEFTLSEDTLAKSGIGIQGLVAGHYRMGSQLQWFVDGMLQHTDYAKKDNDISYMRTRFGHTWFLPKQKLQVFSGYQGVQYKHKPLYAGWLMGLDYQQELSNSLSFSSSVEQQKLNYVSAFDYLDAKQTWINLGLNHYKHGNTRYQYAVRVGKNATSNKTDTYINTALSLNITKQLNWLALTGSAGITFDNTLYQGNDPFFNVKRKDHATKMQLGVLKRDWHWLGFSPKLTMGYNINNSNLRHHDYKQLIFNIALERDF